MAALRHPEGITTSTHIHILPDGFAVPSARLGGLIGIFRRLTEVPYLDAPSLTAGVTFEYADITL